jgi:hypothetical protein
MKLTRGQRKLLIAWNVEGLELWEINERAAKCDPSFEVEWLQLKHVRKQARTKYSDLKEEFEREAATEGYARRGVRLRKKMARLALLEQIRIERARAEDMQDVPGGKTGLLVKDYKGQSVFPVYKLDAALLKEMRDLEREIAIDLGQWTEKKELTGAGGEPLLDPLVAALEKAYGNGKQQSSPND